MRRFEQNSEIEKCSQKSGKNRTTARLEICENMPQKIKCKHSAVHQFTEFVKREKNNNVMKKQKNISSDDGHSLLR